MRKECLVTHTGAEWRNILMPEQFQIMRKHGTEMRAGRRYCINGVAMNFKLEDA